MDEDYLNDIGKRIKRSGFKMTKSRRSIVKVLVEESKPVTAKDIYLRLEGKTDLSSVYRNLNLFKELEIIFEEKNSRGSFFYISEKHHHHIRCIKCGKTKCVPCVIDLEGIEGFSDIEHELTLIGICEECKIDFAGKDEDN